VHFARVFAQLQHADRSTPRLLLLDEPLTFLDVKYQLEFIERIRLMLQENNLLVLAVLHDLGLCAHYADHVLLMKEGKLVCQGMPADVLTAGNIKEVFDVTCEVRNENGKLRLSF
jgi:iron complex transport system ATP-binding protein